MPISEVYNEDCLVGMARYPGNFWDLAIVDPPYGINAPNMQMGSGAPSRGKRLSTAVALKKGILNSGGGHIKNSMLVNSNCDWDKVKPSKFYWRELFRVSKNQIIFGGNYFNPPTTRGIGCWNKKQPWDNFSKWEMIWTSYDCPAWIVECSNTGGNNHEQKIHPTQKPIYVYKYLMGKFAIMGYRILDTHMGSQSSRIAAYQMGFDYWGWELDQEYFKSGCKRFKEQTTQLTLL